MGKSRPNRRLLDGTPLGDIRDEFGDEVVIRILEAKGGGRASIPTAERLRNAADNSGHWLITAVGVEVAIRIAEFLQIGTFRHSEHHEHMQFRGIELDLPTLRSFSLYDRIEKMVLEGATSADEIARACGISRRTIYRYRKRLFAKA